jgi:hypothetical protein
LSEPNPGGNGAFTAGVKIKGGGGNPFDQTDVNGAQTGIDLENTRDNQFGHTRFNAPNRQKIAKTAALNRNETKTRQPAGVNSPLLVRMSPLDNSPNAGPPTPPNLRCA